MRKFELGDARTELRRELVAAVLRGDKIGTAALRAEYDDANPLPQIGEQFELVDFDDKPVGIVETTEIRILRIADCDLAFARDEGEGFETVAAWREAHLRYWRGYWPEPVTDDTLFVAERFRVVTVA